jgi:hypothetical protein
MERKFVIRYQGGSGGFLVAWLLQLAHDFRGAKSPSHVVDALNCFPHSLVNDPSLWKSKEITPPDIGLLCNYFYPIIDKPINDLEQLAHNVLQRTIVSDTTIKSTYDMEARIRYYFCNYVWKKIPEDNNPSAYDIDTAHLVAETDIIFGRNHTVFVTAPRKFISMCQEEKVSGNTEKNIYMTDIINNYKLNTFPIESIWEDTWKTHLEEILSRELTAHQIQVCKLLISRWLYVTPQNIKDEFNI